MKKVGENLEKILLKSFSRRDVMRTRKMFFTIKKRMVRTGLVCLNMLYTYLNNSSMKL